MSCVSECSKSTNVIHYDSEGDDHCFSHAKCNFNSTYNLFVTSTDNTKIKTCGMCETGTLYFIY